MFGRRVASEVSLGALDRRLALLERRVDGLESGRESEEQRRALEQGVVQELDRRGRRHRRMVAAAGALVAAGAGLVEFVRALTGT